ncbi:MAG TPA: hypothetical protein DDY70_02570 [Clostridiales bacterium]|nr:hypothetical protein [Clostridiales bacterium]
MYNDYDDKNPQGKDEFPDGYDPSEEKGGEDDSFGFEGNSFHEYQTEERKSSRPDYAFEALGDLSRPKTRAFSIASLVLGILSLICCCSGFVSFVLGVLAIVFAIVARRHLGYFDGMSIAGMTCGIVGAVLGLMIGILSVTGWIGDNIWGDDPPFTPGGDDINNQF